MNARSIAALGTALVLTSGCYSTTRIYSQPRGASVTIDHKKSLGRTPVELDEQVWIWTKHAITVEAEGYAPQTIQIRSDGVNFGYVVACACTLGLLLPLAAVSKYRKQYVVALLPEVPQASAALTEHATVNFQ